MFTSGFESGEQPAAGTLAPDSTPLILTINGPANNNTVGVSVIQAYGTYSGPANSGIVVDKVPAITNGSAFVSPRIRLVPGSNTITIVTGTLDGQPTSVSRTVIYDPALVQPVLLLASGPGDYAPARMPFSLTTRFPPGQNQVVRVQIDYQDDGIFEVDSSQPVRLEYAYELPGFYTARARVHFDDGDMGTAPVIVEDTTRVLLQSLPFTRETLCRVYYTMKHRLQANTPAAAARTLLPALRPRFTQLWGQLQQASTLAAVAGRLGEIVDGQFSRSTVEPDVTRLPKGHAANRSITDCAVALPRRRHWHPAAPRWKGCGSISPGRCR